MHINSIKNVKPIPLFETVKGESTQESKSSVRFFGPKPVYEPPPTLAAFDLDVTCTSGRVALMYASADSIPQVWFQDLSGAWYYMANTFTDYFRLMVMHLGLSNWHYVFTDVGLDKVTEVCACVYVFVR